MNDVKGIATSVLMVHDRYIHHYTLLYKLQDEINFVWKTKNWSTKRYFFIKKATICPQWGTNHKRTKIAIMNIQIAYIPSMPGADCPSPICITGSMVNTLDCCWFKDDTLTYCNKTKYQLIFSTYHRNITPLSAMTT